MLYAFVIALFVGGATMLGGVLGYFIKLQNKRIDGALFSFAAGVMLAASFAELILPQTGAADAARFFGCLCGVVAGGVLIRLLQRVLTRLEKRNGGLRRMTDGPADALSRAFLFIAALAIHNLPEGAAAGVATGTRDFSMAVTVAAGIALQNVPEGMIVILPLVRAGVSRKKALLVSVLTGVIEIVGTVLGYLAVYVSGAVLPFFLCLAGGTMLYIICTEVLDEANRTAGKCVSGYAFLLGCCAMLIADKYV